MVVPNFLENFLLAVLFFMASPRSVTFCPWLPNEKPAIHLCLRSYFETNRIVSYFKRQLSISVLTAGNYKLPDVPSGNAIDHSTTQILLIGGGIANSAQRWVACHYQIFFEINFHQGCNRIFLGYFFFTISMISMSIFSKSVLTSIVTFLESKNSTISTRPTCLLNTKLLKYLRYCFFF